jgi:branched-chain amino acid transport system ATP-binding protein
MSLLVAERVSRRFQGLFALDNVNLAVEPGARHALIGPNGAGKSTLFNILAGQMPLTSGKVSFEGSDITAMPLHKRVRVGIARTFQRNNLFANKTVFENVRLAAQAHDRAAWAFFARPESMLTINATATEIIERLALGHLAGRKCAELSYGDQRKVELCLALAGRPKVLLLDEPTAGMGRSETKEMIDVLALVPREIAIVIVEHDLDVVSAIADRITVLQNGSIIAEGAWEVIRADEHVKRAYIGKSKKQH